MAEQVLRRALIEHEEMPPPVDLEAGCDVALRLPLAEMYEAIGALTTDNAGWQAVYQLGEEQEVVARLG